jgi:hypothetical protein
MTRTAAPSNPAAIAIGHLFLGRALLLFMLHIEAVYVAHRSLLLGGLGGPPPLGETWQAAARETRQTLALHH